MITRESYILNANINSYKKNIHTQILININNKISLLNNTKSTWNQIPREMEKIKENRGFII